MHATAFITRRENGQPVFAVMAGREVLLETFDRGEAIALRDATLAR